MEIPILECGQFELPDDVKNHELGVVGCTAQKYGAGVVFFF